MQYNYPLREDRRKLTDRQLSRQQFLPNFDYFATNQQDNRRYVRTMQRTELSAGTSREQKSGSRSMRKRKTSESPMASKQHLRNRLKQPATHRTIKGRCQRTTAIPLPKHARRSHQRPHLTVSHRRSGTTDCEKHSQQKQEMLVWKEQQLKWNLERKAMQIYRQEIYTQSRRTANPDHKKSIVQQFLKGRRQQGRNVLLEKPTNVRTHESILQDDYNPYLVTGERIALTQQICSHEKLVTDYSSNFNRLVSFKQPNQPSFKIHDVNPASETQSISKTQLAKPAGFHVGSTIPTFGLLPPTKEPSQNHSTEPNTALHVAVAPSAHRDWSSEENQRPLVSPFEYETRYLKDDSASGSGSAKSLKLESTVSRKAFRRLGGRSRISSKFSNLSAFRGSAFSRSLQFEEVRQKIQLHLEVVSRMAEYVEESGNLYSSTIWRCENFMMYKRYYLERMRVHEALSGSRNCFTLTDLEVPMDVLQKYLLTNEIRSLSEQVNRHNSEVYACLSGMHRRLPTESSNYPTLNLLFDKVSTSRLNRDIIAAFSKEFAALRRIYTAETDEERRIAIEQRLIDIVQLTYLIEELSDNFVRSFLECEMVETFEEFLLVHESVFMATVRKYVR